MSEYQYYEFRTFNTPLSEKQKQELYSLSSRGYVTSHKARYIYNYSDLPADPNELIIEMFDFGFYMTNWGTRSLTFRLPVDLVDIDRMEEYCLLDEIQLFHTDSDEYLLLTLSFHDEDYSAWLEDDGCAEYCSELAELYRELLSGDYRGLYIAWLKAASSLSMDDSEEYHTEPPVPAGLGNPTSTQRTLMQFFQINPSLPAVAATQSKDENRTIDVQKLITQLSEKEKNDFLLRLSRSEANLTVLLNKRLRELATDHAPKDDDREAGPRRTIGGLLDAAEKHHEREKEDERRRKLIARQQALEAMSSKKENMWLQVETLVAAKIASSYNKATELLVDLRDLAAMEGESTVFQQRVKTLAQRITSQKAMLDRMHKAQII